MVLSRVDAEKIIADPNSDEKFYHNQANEVCPKIDVFLDNEIRVRKFGKHNKGNVYVFQLPDKAAGMLLYPSSIYLIAERYRQVGWQVEISNSGALNFSL